MSSRRCWTSPAPKLDVEGRLDPGKASEQELRGEKLFYGKAACAGCHAPPYFTDNLMHNLKVERFYDPKLVNGVMASADGPIKTFPLRGIKGFAAVPARRPPADPGGHRGVLQPGAGAQAVRGREGRPGGLPAYPVRKAESQVKKTRR